MREPPHLTRGHRRGYPHRPHRPVKMGEFDRCERLWKVPAPMADWRVVRVATNSENAVAARLSQRDITSYYPRYLENRMDQRTHRRRFVERCLFPCYLFVRTKLSFLLWEVEGIVALLRAQNAKLDEAILRLRASEINGFVPLPKIEIISRFRKGDPVRVISGVFRGHNAVCTRALGTKVNIQVDLFGRKVGVWHSESDLAAV